MLQRRDFLKFAALPAAAASNSKPNIIFILADDLGYGDLSCLNAKSKIQTPNLDRFAQEGMIFTDAHTPSSVCTPTRYGVITGRYCWRSRLKDGVLQGGSPPLLEEGRLTVPAMLKTKGYTTACFGKWHLGLGWASKNGRPVGELCENVDFTKPYTKGPTTAGFDYYYGISASLDMPPYTFLENDRAATIPDTKSEGEPFPRNWRPGPAATGFKHQQVLSTLTGKATGWIDQWSREKPKSRKPFFIYFPMTAPHTPVVPREEFKNRTGAGDFGAFVAEVDWAVKQVLDAVERAGAKDNTLIMFTSDNGPEKQMVERKTEFQHFSAGQFRGHKRHLWDGGHHVAFLARWPGKIKPGSRSDEIICLTDLMATCAAITGVKLPKDAGEDSFNLLPAMTGQKLEAPIREAVVHHSASGAFAIRQGEWKLIELRGVGDGAPAKDESLPPGQLYNVIKDPGEEKNVYRERPEIVQRLSSLLDRYKSQGRSAPDGSSW